MAIDEQLTSILLILVMFTVSEARRIGVQKNGFAKHIYQTIDQVTPSHASKLQMKSASKQKLLGKATLLPSKKNKKTKKKNKSNSNDSDGKKTPLYDQLNQANKVLKKSHEESPMYTNVNALKITASGQPNFNGLLPANGGKSNTKKKGGISSQKLHTPKKPLPSSKQNLKVPKTKSNKKIDSKHNIKKLKEHSQQSKEHIYEEISLNPVHDTKQRPKNVINSQESEGIYDSPRLDGLKINTQGKQEIYDSPRIDGQKISSGVDQSTHKNKLALNFVNRLKKRHKEAMPLNSYNVVKVQTKGPPKQKSVDSQPLYDQVNQPADRGNRVNSPHHHDHLQDRHFKTQSLTKTQKRPHYLALIREDLARFKMTPEEIEQGRRQKNKAVQQKGPRKNIAAH